MRRLAGSLSTLALIGFVAAGCAMQTAATPIDEGDLVYSGVGPAEASNLERFDAFLAVTESGGDDAVRIVNVTVEGDPVYTDISYREGKYVVYLDASEDKFASEANRTRKKAAECNNLVPSDRPDEYDEYACGKFKFVIQDS